MIIDHIGKVIEHRPINALAETLLTNEEARFGPVLRLISQCCQSRYQKIGHHQYLTTVKVTQKQRTRFCTLPKMYIFNRLALSFPKVH